MMNNVFYNSPEQPYHSLPDTPRSRMHSSSTSYNSRRRSRSSSDFYHSTPYPPSPLTYYQQPKDTNYSSDLHGFYSTPSPYYQNWRYIWTPQASKFLHFHCTFWCQKLFFPLLFLSELLIVLIRPNEYNLNIQRPKNGYISHESYETLSARIVLWMKIIPCLHNI